MNNSSDAPHIPFGSTYNVGSFPFPLIFFGSLTAEEIEYMADNVRAVDIQRLEAIEKFATAISEKEKISVDESITFITKLLDNDFNDTDNEPERVKLMSFSMRYRENILEMKKQNDPNKLQIFQTKAVALMILTSRLDTQWLLENFNKLNKTYRLNLEQSNLAELLTIPEEKWLFSEKRKNIFERLIKKLPITEIRELAGFALAEEREWENVEFDIDSEKKILSSDLEIIVMGSESNENSTEKPITKSVSTESAIQSSTRPDIIDAQPKLSEKHSKK